MHINEHNRVKISSGMAWPMKVASCLLSMLTVVVIFHEKKKPRPSSTPLYNV